MKFARAGIRWIFALCVAGSATGCGVHFRHLPAGSIAGRDAAYDYSPTVLQSGNLVQVWWCGTDDNTSDRSQISDAIEYQSVDLSTNARSVPIAVLEQTQNAWDAAYLCNPKVVRGVFANPVGDGATYTYAMYYVATSATTGLNNSIGVAFSNDGAVWKKYPHPIVTASIKGLYGVGQPAVFNSNHQSNILMFYEDSTIGNGHVAVSSSDGVHFTPLGLLTAKGLDPANPQASWGDMAYDPKSGYWYASFNLPTRDPATTGMVAERGQYGIQLYRIPNASLFTGETPWQLLTIIDTTQTGYESNFLSSFLRDPYGNLNVGDYPKIKMYTSISNPPAVWNASPAQAGASGSIADWDLSTAVWTPDQPLRALQLYSNQMAHEATTGWVDPAGGWVLQSTLGHLYEGPQSGATLPLFSCKTGTTDYFVSTDRSCAGALLLGTIGYGYAKPVAGLPLVALYRCSTGTDDFISNDARCDAKATPQLLGYTLP